MGGGGWGYITGEPYKRDFRILGIGCIFTLLIRIYTSQTEGIKNNYIQTNLFCIKKYSCESFYTQVNSNATPNAIILYAISWLNGAFYLKECFASLSVTY